jgi:hypothetical protein
MSEERNWKAICAMMTLLIGMLTLALIQPINTEPSGNFLAYVIFADDSPVQGALIKVFDPPDLENPIGLGFTNATGYWETTLSLSGNEWYHAYAYYPDTSTYFGDALFQTDGDGNGNVTIKGSYEITPPVVEILSPENKTYETTIIPASLPLNFTVDDYSPIDQMWYNLDNQPTNTTIEGNTTLTDLALGSHNVIVYANDTKPGIGSIDFDEVYFNVSVHDIVITNITFSEQNPSINETIFIYVTVINKGGFNETFDVSVNYTRIIDPLIGTQNVTLAPTESITLNFTWTPTANGRYQIKVYTGPIPDDIDPSDNTKIIYLYVGSNPSSGSNGGSRFHICLLT